MRKTSSSSAASRPPRFSERTLQFLKKAPRQKRPDWLIRNRAEYEEAILDPLHHLARELKATLSPVAPGYHFPQKGLGRLKRSQARAEEYGALFREWLSYSASRPSGSRFDHNPNLYFMIYPDDPDGDFVLVAGGLYMPSSRQLRSIREAIAQDASAFDRLFASKEFKSRFPGGFSDEKKSSRPPRGFDPDHPRIEWLKLQGYFVWKPYKKREFTSPGFALLVADDCRQILRLNELLEQAIQGRWVKEKAETEPRKETRASGLSTRLENLGEGFEAPRRKMDF